VATNNSALSDKEVMALTLRKTRAFAAWPPTAMSQLLASSRLCWHVRGDSLSGLTEAPDEVFVVASGQVIQFETSPGGIRLYWALRGPGQILGFSLLLDLAESRREFVANDDVVAVHVPGRLLFELLDASPVRWKDMGRMLVQQEREQMDLIFGQITGELPQRLAKTIHQLAALQGIRANEESAIHLRLTRQDLASLLGVSRQSVQKELITLEAAGVVKLKYNAIVILDEFALKRIFTDPLPLWSTKV